MKTSREVLHIRNMLKKQARKRHLSFHTPGHKKKGADITELSYSDNLAAPKGCLLQAERDIARILRAEKSFILTDGSTCGVLSMLYAAKARGVKRIAFYTQSHKSVFNGCKLTGITPLLLSCAPSAKSLTGEDKETFAAADALFLTSPDYYGNIPDLRSLRALCDQARKYLIVDGAHGSHLHFDDEVYAGRYADMWVDGVHKNLPARTQGAVVSAKDKAWAEKLLEGVEIFRTTSPSYPIMESVEYAVKYPRNLRLEKRVRAYAEKETRVRLNRDWTKLCVYFGEQALQAEKELEKRGIYPEFCDGETILFYLSPKTSLCGFSRLTRALASLFKKYPKCEEKQTQRNPAPLVLPEKQEKEWVELANSEGRICGENCGLFPPCTPLIVKGERIEKDKIERIRNADNAFGVYEGKILVFKE